MTNAVYQATVMALETLLPPRVVSRTLQEGLEAVTKTPATLQYADVDKILKAQVYRQLQVVMPVTEAKTKLQNILESLKKIAPEAEGEPGAPPLENKATQAAALDELRASLKPFNLYFEWPEVQKLRAQLQLLEAEHEAGRETGRLLDEARQGLASVEQKLTDQLVYQAKALGELTTSFEVVKFLGGSKVRRLENLMGQVQMAQQARSLAPAEVERAYKILADLRKLMESSVVVESAPVQSEEGLLEAESEADDLLSRDPDPPNARPPAAAASAKLLQIDLDDERRSLDKLASDCADLLSYRPALAAQLAEQTAQLATGTSVAASLERLRADFADAAVAERTALSREFESVQAEVRAWASVEAAATGSAAGLDAAGLDTADLDATNLGTAGLDTTELAQHLQVTLSVLSTALPPLRDVQHLRSLYHLASSRYQETQRQGEPVSDERESMRSARETRLAEQLSELHKLEEKVGGYGNVTLPEFQDLRAQLQEARAQLEQDEPLDTLADLWTRLDTVKTLLARRSADFGRRLDAALKTFHEVAKLNSEEVIRVGTLLTHLDGQRDAVSRVSAGVRDELAAALTEAETLLSELQSQYGAARAVADQLAGSSALEGLFGFFDAPPTPSAVQTATPSGLELWLADHFAETGVQSVLVFDPQGRVLSAQGLDPADDLYPAFVKLEHSAAELGGGLALGEAGVTVIELLHTALISATLEPGYRLALLVEPARLDERLLDFPNRLAELHDFVQP